jgi:mRNA interferase MazF
VIRRGDVRWYRFKKPDRRRPVVVLTRNSVIDVLAEVTVAPITATIRDIPTEVTLGTADGMPRDCAVNLDHLQTVSKSKLGDLVTNLTPAKLGEVRAALLFALGY